MSYVFDFKDFTYPNYLSNFTINISSYKVKGLRKIEGLAYNWIQSINQYAANMPNMFFVIHNYLSRNKL